MIKTLIANTNLNEIKKIIDILKNFEEIHIVNISTTTIEAKESIIENLPDLIFIENNSFYFPEISLIKLYNPKIINISNHINIKSLQKFLKTKESNLIKPLNNNQIENTFTKLAKKIFGKLVTLNFNSQMKGTLYLSEIIAYTYLNDKNSKTISLSKDIYPAIAERHNINSKNIKWDTIKSINKMEKKNIKENPKIVKNFLNQNISMKSTPKFVITHFTRAIIEHAEKIEEI